MKIMNLFRRKSNPAMRAVLAMMGWSKTGYPDKDLGRLTRAGFMNVAAIFACVSLLAKSSSRISWIVSRRTAGGKLKELEDHPLRNTLARPNAEGSGIRFQEKVFAYYQLYGNSFILKVHGAESLPPQFLYTLRPDRMEIEKGTWKEPVRFYTYTAGGHPESFKPADILHLKEFHPLDDWFGLSRLEIAAQQIDISNLGGEWNLNLLKNDMRIPGVLTGKNILESEIDLARKLFHEHYQGHERAGTPLILSGEDLKWDNISLNPKDSDWLEALKRALRQICAIYGVSSELLGDSENKTYSNIQEARKALYTENILPLMDIYRDELNAWLVPFYGERLYLDYDRDAIEALQEEREKKYSYLTQANWLTINEKRVACTYDEIEGGDVILVPMSELPLGSPSRFDDGDDDKARGGVRAIKAIKKSFWTVPERKERLWKAFEARVTVRQRTFMAMAEKYLDRQWRELRAKFSKLPTMAHASARALFDADSETAKYAKTFGVWYRDNFIRAGNAGMRASKGELFDDGEWKADKPKPTSWVFTATEEELEALHDMIFNSGTAVNAVTLAVVEAAIKRANVENMTVEEFAQEIWREVADFDPWRARLWARTESAKVDNYGNLEGYRKTEFVERKGWMCSRVPDSRQEHKDADGEEVPLNEPFTRTGEDMMYPGDPSGSAGNVCNCLCATYPVVGEV